jgi:hypothetical protein
MTHRHRMLAIVQHDFDVLGKVLLTTLAAGFVVFAVVAAVMDLARIAH